MANTFLLKRASQASKVPQTSDLTSGELALNFTDGRLYYRHSSGTVAEINASDARTLGGLNKDQFLQVGSSFSGDGSLLTNLNAANLATGTVPPARLPLPTTGERGAVRRNTGASGEYVLGIAEDGDLLYGTPAGIGVPAEVTSDGYAVAFMPVATPTTIGGVKRNLPPSPGEYITAIEADGSLRYSGAAPIANVDGGGASTVFTSTAALYGGHAAAFFAAGSNLDGGTSSSIYSVAPTFGGNASTVFN